MVDPFRQQTIETWVGDFADSPAFRELPAPAQEYASEVLPAFLARACDERTSDTPRPITNPGSKLGRNDPCPCGSGLEYKKCCMRR